MATIQIATNFNIDLEFETPSFHRRLIAWSIDVFMLVLYIIIALKFLNWLWHQTSYNSDKGDNFWAIFLLIVIPAFTYHLLCEVFMNGQSVGKKLLGLRVVNENGGKAGISQYIIRWLIRTSDYMILIIALYAPIAAAADLSFFWKIAAAFGLLIADVILVNATKKHQRLGDILAHTLVIKTSQKASIQDTVFLQVADNYTPSFPQILQLTDRDINALKSIFDAARKNQDFDLAQRAAEKIQTHLKITTSMSPFDFLEVLLKDYNSLASS